MLEVFGNINLVILVISILTAVKGIILYNRWRRNSYKLLSSFLCAAVVIQLCIYVASLLFSINEISSFIMTRLIMLQEAAFIFCFLGIFHIFNPKKRTELNYFFVAAALSIVALITTILFRDTSMDVIYCFISIGISASFLFWATPKMKSKRSLVIGVGVHAAGTLSLLFFFVYLFHNTLLIVAFSTLITTVIYNLILINRIFDILNAASYSSVIDGLTGLFNKTHFKRKVTEVLTADRPCAVIFSDIDNFKKLNDTHGHEVGDQALKLASRLLQEVCADIGVAARYGGEELVALIFQGDPARISEIYRRRVEEESPAITAFTVSIGFARYDGEVESGDEFIDQADQALYYSKKNGKNRVTSYDVLPAKETPVLVITDNHQMTDNHQVYEDLEKQDAGQLTELHRSNQLELTHQEVAAAGANIEKASETDEINSNDTPCNDPETNNDSLGSESEVGNSKKNNPLAFNPFKKN